MSNRFESYRACFICCYFFIPDSSSASFYLLIFTFANSSSSSVSSLVYSGCASSLQLPLLFSGYWPLYSDPPNCSYICDNFYFLIQNTICSSLVMMLFLMELRICFRLRYLASFLLMSLATEAVYWPRSRGRSSSSGIELWWCFISAFWTTSSSFSDWFWSTPSKSVMTLLSSLVSRPLLKILRLWVYLLFILLLVLSFLIAEIFAFSLILSRWMMSSPFSKCWSYWSWFATIISRP